MRLKVKKVLKLTEIERGVNVNGKNRNKRTLVMRPILPDAYSGILGY